LHSSENLSVAVIAVGLHKELSGNGLLQGVQEGI